jgi:serine/threonine protein kinase
MNTVIFINENAVSLDDIILDQEWYLEKMFKNIYSIYVCNKKINLIVKTYDKMKNARREILNLNKLKKVHGVPVLLAVCLSKCLNYIIISEAKGLDLFEYTKKIGYFSELNLKPIIKNILNILKNIHDRNVIHMDIKPENIVYNHCTKEVVLIDFESRHTRDYMSPEQMNGETICSKTDLWSLGVTVCYLICGDVKHVPTSFSKELKDFLKHLMEVDVCKRYNAKQALNHVWINL